MGAEWHSYPTGKAAAEACAGQVLSFLSEVLSAPGGATLAISGGSSPGYLFDRLATASIAWDRVHLFWVDERAVPPEDSRSNYRLASERLIVPANIPLRNTHRIQAELAPEMAARRYAGEIREFFGLAEGELPRFDVIHRGMGSDAHTASLFPGETLVNDRQGIAAAVHVRRLSERRITLLPGVLLAAGYTVVLAAGDDKAEAVRAVFRERYDPVRYPAQLGQDRQTAWFMDEAAARLLY
jgi:6-phosphogluconolactonase